MPSNEVFASPTVTQVIFQIMFPNLFYIAAKIGDLQLKLIERFPESKLLQSRSILIADLGPESTLQDLPEMPQAPGLQTIWQFISPDGVQLNITSSSLALVSTQHKTYNSPGEIPRFRDAIQAAITPFLDIVQVPLLTRIGLRYKDHCPLPALTNEAFSEYYNTTFPIGRFPVSDALELKFTARIRRPPFFLRFSESFNSTEDMPKFITGDKPKLPTEDKPKLVLDFDGYATDVPSKDYLKTADALHEMISDEYHRHIKEPVRQAMRRPKE